MSKRNTTTQPTMDHVPAPWAGWDTRRTGRPAAAGTVYGIAQRQVGILISEFWRNGKRLTPDQAAFVEAMRESADNTLHGLMHGLTGLGDVLAAAVRNPDGPTEEALSSVGWLLETIAGTMISAQSLLADAAHLSALQRGQADTEDAA
ncbi:MAG: hypothetical protein AB7U81_15265 [Thiohalomonadaceae bacterium]